MAVGIIGGTKVLIEVRPQFFLPLKGVTQWATSGGERTSTTRDHLNIDDGTLALPGAPSNFTIDINDCTAVLTHETWKVLREAFGDPENRKAPRKVNVALLTDGSAEEEFTTAAEVGATIAVTGADYTGATGKYYRMGLAEVKGSDVGDSSKQITRLKDAGIETGKQFEVGGQILSVADIVTDTDSSKTFRVTNPTGDAVTAVGTAAVFKSGDPVECYGLTTRTSPAGFSCIVLNPGTPSRTAGDPRVVSAQLQPDDNRLPNPTLIAFQ